MYRTQSNVIWCLAGSLIRFHRFAEQACVLWKRGSAALRFLLSPRVWKADHHEISFFACLTFIPEPFVRSFVWLEYMNLLLTSFIHFNVAFYNCWSQAVWSRLSLHTLLNIFFVTYTTRQPTPESIQHNDLWHLSVYCSISASIYVTLQAKWKMRRRRRNCFEKISFFCIYLRKKTKTFVVQVRTRLSCIEERIWKFSIVLRRMIFNYYLLCEGQVCLVVLNGRDSRS